MPRFELVEGSSNKFWEIEIAAQSVTVKFGRIGTAGQVQTKSFSSTPEAQAHYDRLLGEKLKKGYIEVGNSIETLAEAAVKNIALSVAAKSPQKSSASDEITLPKAISVEKDDPAAVKKLKQKIAKRFSLIVFDPLNHMLTLAYYLVALELPQEALEILNLIADQGHFGSDSDCRFVVDVASRLRARLLWLSGRKDLAEQGLEKIRQKPGLAIGGYLMFLKGIPNEIERAYNEEETEVACSSLKGVLDQLIIISEAARFRIDLPQGVSVNLSDLDKVTNQVFTKLQYRLLGHAPDPNSVFQQKKRSEQWLQEQIEAARETALNGEAERAIEMFEYLIPEHSADVRTMLMQLYAYQGRWNDVLSSLDAYVSLPQLNYILPIHMRLGARAAVNTNSKKTLAQITERQIAKLLSHRKAVPQNATLLQQFAVGKADHQEPFSQMFSVIDVKTPARSDEYADYITHITEHMPPYARKDPKAKIFYSFCAAFDFRMHDKAIRLYEEHESLRFDRSGRLNWQLTSRVCRIFCARNDHERAWELLIQALPGWFGSGVELAPTELITDQCFMDLMTDDRRHQLLHTPRSREVVSVQAKPPSTQAGKQGKAACQRVKKLTVALSRAAQPITQPITKFGGQPNWLDQPKWPLSERYGRPMSFLCQIQLDPSVFGQIGAKMAYIFMTGDDDTGNAEATWDPAGGENAVIIQPGGEISVKTAENTTGPSIFSEMAVSLTPGDDLAETDDEQEEDDDGSELKIGGSPVFIQGDEFPEGGRSGWHLLLQASEGSLPDDVNFGTGCAYAFISKDGRKGKFLWQC